MIIHPKSQKLLSYSKTGNKKVQLLLRNELKSNVSRFTKIDSIALLFFKKIRLYSFSFSKIQIIN